MSETRSKESVFLDPADEKVEIRVHGSESQPTLVYLPGLHGDWTLVGAFRRALSGRVRFVEITYPRTLNWTLDDYASEVTRSLAELGITGGWLLAESFSSQVVWQILEAGEFHAEGLILAGGFVRHPMTWAARFAETFCASVPFSWITGLLFGYARVVRRGLFRSPEAQADIAEFIARRTREDLQAAKWRLHLVANSDPCRIVRDTTVPVYGISGLIDPVVPWFWVRRWLKRNCPALREYRVLRADHNVLGTASKVAAEQVLAWMGPAVSSTDFEISKTIDTLSAKH